MSTPNVNVTSAVPRQKSGRAGRDTREIIVLTIAIAVIAFCIVASARVAGWLERVELVMHDHILDSRAGLPPHPDIVVIYETEADLQRFGHPLSDETLAAFLSKVETLQPAMVAVDKYRDLPVAPGSAALDQVLTDNANIFWIAKYGAAAFDGVRPPKVLEGTQRAACADIVVDADLRVRRALMAIGEGEKACPSLAYVLAATYLNGKGIAAGFDAANNFAFKLGNNTVHRVAPWDGPYAGADTSGYQVSLTMRRAVAKSFTLSQVFDGSVPAEAIKGKTVFFGSSATSLRDFFDVPHRKVNPQTLLPGVMIHALIFGELVDIATSGETFSLVPVERTFVLTALMALLCALFKIAATRVTWGTGLAIAAVIAWWPASIALAYANIVVAPVAPALAGLLATMMAAGYRAWREARDRQELMGWFSKHVSREVAEAIWNERDQFTAGGIIPPQSVRVTVLFADIRNYTTISESMDVPQMVAWLNRAISCMCDAVMDNHGVVTRFAGDQVMAVFGVPIPRKTEQGVRDDGAHAIDAGLAMGTRLETLNHVFTQEKLPSARVRVGIFSGNVVQAGLGSRERFEFTVLGDVVNTASRLESHNSTDDDGAGARVLIGAPTKELVGELFETTSLGTPDLKGKKMAVEVFRVHRRAETKGTI